MVKQYKIWFWASLLAFLVPVILILYVPTRNFLTEQYTYKNHPSYLLLTFLVASLANISLLIFNFKINRNKFKFLFSFLLILSLAFLLFSLYAGYYMRNGIGF